MVKVPDRLLRLRPPRTSLAHTVMDPLLLRLPQQSQVRTRRPSRTLPKPLLLPAQLTLLQSQVHSVMVLAELPLRPHLPLMNPDHSEMVPPPPQAL